jgi:LmbE family N-acetylglucosaminyl deacetylase
MTDLHDELPQSQRSLTTPERVLAIGAHPDDVEFGCGALLARWSDEGSTVALCIVTDGSKGSWDSDEDQQALTQRRKAEQERAGEVLGVSGITFLDHIDGELEYSMDLRRDIAIMIRRVRPNVVLSHDPWQRYQLHPDHRVTGIAATDGVVAAREPLAYMESGQPAHRPEHLLLWSADAPDHAEPVDAPWSDRKAEALLCHSSQGQTTMGDAHMGAAERSRFVASLDARHHDAGQVLGVGPAETFKRLTP